MDRRRLTASHVSTVPAHAVPGGSVSLVLVADRATRSVALACGGRGRAALTVRAARLMLSTVADPVPIAAVEVAVTGRDHQTCTLRVAVRHGQATLVLRRGETVLRHWHIARRSALAAALTGSVDHLTGSGGYGATLTGTPRPATV
ncbi:hypothetical protein FHR81_001748 [Actinoalloteichus hoggarensis]|uniref:Uncharacterized protein n=1 Tax=Actinoalloteichus hoggarensis TaxID=1470176 RepID=A0A221W4G8_9PSEU|nr:hypothetical protein [Actinoalloteichus hoggarensis]ASO20780.1 hypothetical protein AHOG_15770 [Actinoalloteichus hoggarensis]MBB5920710.1 hypothetical protein [Actinoalloteichus hoggarensis]